MELRRYAQLLRRRILLLALAASVGLAAGFVTTDRTPRYRAEASIYVGSRQFAAIGESTNASAAMDRLIGTFAAMIKSAPVATAAIQLASVPRSPSQVVAATGAAAVPNTNYIVVFVTDTDPAVAQALDDGVARSFVDQVQKLEPGTATSGASTAVTSVFQQASRPTTPLPTSTRRNLLLGGLFGLGAGVALVTLLNYLDIGVKSTESVERSVGLPVLATIPVMASPATGSRSAGVARKTAAGTGAAVAKPAAPSPAE
jgi:succinoglycan biosynthesis transport protein ExoP